MNKPSELYDYQVKQYPPRIQEEAFRIKSYYKYFLGIDVQVLFLTAVGVDSPNNHIKPSEIGAGQRLVYVGEFATTKNDMNSPAAPVTLRSLNVVDLVVTDYPINVICMFDGQWEGYNNGNIYKVIPM